MNEQVCQAPITFLDRFQRRLNHITWPYTSKVAYQIYLRTHWALELKPKDCPRIVWCFLSGLAEGCWTHVCGHGPKYGLRIAMIYWRPREMSTGTKTGTKD